MDDTQKILCYSHPFLVFHQKPEEIKDNFYHVFPVECTAWNYVIYLWTAKNQINLKKTRTTKTDRFQWLKLEYFYFKSIAHFIIRGVCLLSGLSSAWSGNTFIYFFFGFQSVSLSDSHVSHSSLQVSSTAKENLFHLNKQKPRGRRARSHRVYCSAKLEPILFPEASSWWFPGICWERKLNK